MSLTEAVAILLLLSSAKIEPIEVVAFTAVQGTCCNESSDANRRVRQCHCESRHASCHKYMAHRNPFCPLELMRTHAHIFL